VKNSPPIPEVGKSAFPIFDNVQDSKAPTGNSQAQALRRLSKDRPDLHAKVLSGEIKSANKAMVAAV